MGYEYILGGIIASSLVLVFVIYGSVSKRKAKSSVHAESNGGSIIRTSPENGNHHQEISETTDVIIVGAGVAGAALAYTLGKVEQTFSWHDFVKSNPYVWCFFLVTTCKYVLIHRYMQNLCWGKIITITIMLESHVWLPESRGWKIEE